jgi:hypothetical protein
MSGVPALAAELGELLNVVRFVVHNAEPGDGSQRLALERTTGA